MQDWLQASGRDRLSAYRSTGQIGVCGLPGVGCGVVCEVGECCWSVVGGTECDFGAVCRGADDVAVGVDGGVAFCDEAGQGVWRVVRCWHGWIIAVQCGTRGVLGWAGEGSRMVGRGGSRVWGVFTG